MNAGDKFGFYTATSETHIVDTNGRLRRYRTFVCECGFKLSGREDRVFTNGFGKGYKEECPHSRRKGDSARAWEVYSKGYADGNLTFEDFLLYAKQPCWYCGVLPKNSRKSKSKMHPEPYIYNGLDRLDNSKPHDSDNVVSCCQRCNRKKSADNVHDFADWIKTVYERIWT